MFQIQSLVVGPFQSNCHIVWCDQTNEGVIFDAGDEGARIVETTKRLGITVKAVINTHAHLDHVSGLAEVIDALGVPVFMHADDMPIYDMVGQQAIMFGLSAPRKVEIEKFLLEGDRVNIGELQAEVIHAPGHSPGSVCFGFWDESPPRVIVGDVLFMGSIGRTDLPGGDYDTIMTSLKTKFVPMPDDTVVYSGHGPETTIGQEKIHNPFLAPLVG